MKRTLTIFVLTAVAALYAALLLLALSGCVADHNGRQTVDFKQPAAPAALNSQNAIQETFSGLGAQIGKVADRLDGLGGLIGQIDNNLSSEVVARAELSARVDAQIETRIHAEAQLKASVEAAIQARIDAAVKLQADAHAAAVMALNASFKEELSKFEQSNSAGRDQTVNTVQYSREMMQTFEKFLATYEASNAQSDSTLKWVVGALFALFTGLAALWIYASHRRAVRAEARGEEAVEFMYARERKE